jgi:sodium-dependent dicarboxylate transporter 2/3/5
MLAIAYSASIGGMATQIGTPPNLVFAGIIKETYGIEITFYQWLVFGLPISIFLLGICWLYLTKIAFKFKEQTLPGGRQEIETQLNLLGKMSYEEKLILSVFVLTALAWIIRPFVLSIYFPAVDDTIIAIISAIILFILPSKASKERLLNWEDIVKLPWGILLLFGGGMALAIGFETSGLANWIGLQLTSLGSIHLFLILLILISVVNFLTEITSNLATTAMLLPVLVSLASAVNIHPYYLLVGATLAASCAFMLPVATPPNAVVFGSKLLSIEDMVKKGLWMNLISIISLALIVYFILPLLWDVASPL